MMKPEPSELTRRGVWPPPPCPPWPRRFLKNSSKNSSNGEPGGSCGMALLLMSTVCLVEILTTASITASATSEMSSGPRAAAGGRQRPSDCRSGENRQAQAAGTMRHLLEDSAHGRRFS